MKIVEARVHEKVFAGQRDIAKLAAIAENIERGFYPSIAEVAAVGGTPVITVYGDSTILSWSLHLDIWDGCLSLEVRCLGDNRPPEVQWHYSYDQGGAI